jgi:ATP phosphoribosyltransferase regulatory subunit
MDKQRWLLPEGIEEVLPPQAQVLEAKRRALLDLYWCWGYELVMPPFIEYLDSLLIGTGDDLDLQTFKITDQLNGRMMGVRADMTPQVARIDAHLLRRETPTRLCYMGTVLHTRPKGFAASRAPLQIGLELYGHAGIESDVEVFQLMCKTLEAFEIRDVYFDLGHVGIYRGLVKQSGLDAEQESQLFDTLQRKAKPELRGMLQSWALDKAIQNMFIALADLNGDESVLVDARKQLSGADQSVQQAITELENIAAAIRQHMPAISLHYDLAELRGYHYHTGAVFAAFVTGQGQAIAQGGRYDGIGKVFGNARPATGFSTDLKTLMALSPPAMLKSGGIFAPAGQEADLLASIEKLRASGERVVMALPGQTGDARTMQCDRQLVKQGNDWVVKSI